jgi:hypothetical protein
MNSISNPQVVGLLFDAIGICILGIPATYRMVQEIVAQSGTYYDANPHLAKALSENRIDLTVGSIILLVGFGFQLIGTLDYFFIRPVGLLLCIACVLFLPLYFLFLRSWLSKLLLNRVKAALAAKHSQPT